MFADDVKLSMRIMDVSDCVRLQACLNKLAAWCSTNRLQLNVGKCKSITYTNKHCALDFTYKINDTALEKVSKITDLGITFDSRLNFGDHIMDISTRAFQRIGFIMRNC